MLLPELSNYPRASVNLVANFPARRFGNGGGTGDMRAFETPIHAIVAVS